MTPGIPIAIRAHAYISVHLRTAMPPDAPVQSAKGISGPACGGLMFARGLFGGFAIRRILGLLGGVLSAVGGLLVLVAVFASGHVGLTAGTVFGALLGLGALFAALRIYRAGHGILFPRVRLMGAGILSIILGVILVALSFGTAGLLVLGGGVVALIATAV